VFRIITRAEHNDEYVVSVLNGNVEKCMRTKTTSNDPQKVFTVSFSPSFAVCYLECLLVLQKDYCYHKEHARINEENV
jgi:hypothetical protein